MGETTEIRWPDIRAEARRLNELGTLTVEFEGAAERQILKRTRCVGFAINSREQDCLLFLGPYGASGRFAIRSIPAKEIGTITVVGGKPGPRIDREMTG